MSDFISLAQTFGLPLAMTITAVAILARALVIVSRDKDRANEQRFSDMRDQYEARLQEVTQDRDWHRDRLYQALGLTDSQSATLEELVKRVAQQIPPPRGR